VSKGRGMAAFGRPRYLDRRLPKPRTGRRPLRTRAGVRRVSEADGVTGKRATRMVSGGKSNVSRLQSCDYVKADGTVCGAPANRSGFCIGHAPTAAEARRAGGRAGGRAARAERLLPPRLSPVLDDLRWAMDGLREGSVDPKVATAMASVARAMTDTAMAGELEMRLRRLERTEQMAAG